MPPQPDTRAVILDAIEAIAPEVDAGAVDGDADFSDELDLDSMDQLNIAVLVFENTGVNVAEGDQAKVTTLNAFVRYIDAALLASTEPRES